MKQKSCTLLDDWALGKIHVLTSMIQVNIEDILYVYDFSWASNLTFLFAK